MDIAGMAVAALSVGGAMVSITAAIIGNRYKVAALKQHVAEKAEALEKANGHLKSELNQLRDDLRLSIRELNEAVKSSAHELNAAATTIKVMASETAIINRMTTQTLESLTEKVEEHSKEINELSGTTGLISELLTKHGLTR